MDDVNLDSLRLTRESQIGIENAKRSQKKSRKSRHPDGWFIWGPIPGHYVSRAAALPGKSLTLWLALWSEHWRRKGQPLRMTRELLGRFHLTPDSAHLALKHLEHAGLLTAQRGRGRLATVSLLLTT